MFNWGSQMWQRCSGCHWWSPGLREDVSDDRGKWGANPLGCQRGYSCSECIARHLPKIEMEIRQLQPFKQPSSAPPNAYKATHEAQAFSCWKLGRATLPRIRWVHCALFANVADLFHVRTFQFRIMVINWNLFPDDMDRMKAKVGIWTVVSTCVTHCD